MTRMMGMRGMRGMMEMMGMTAKREGWDDGEERDQSSLLRNQVCL
jgi:hypothetical protein